MMCFEFLFCYTLGRAIIILIMKDMRDNTKDALLAINHLWVV